MNILGKSCNGLTEDQLEALSELGDFEPLEGCLNTLNTCGMSLSDLLDSYPSFFTPGILPLLPGENIIFVEDNWLKVVLKTATSEISNYASLFNDSNWNILCSIKNTDLPVYENFSEIWPLHQVGRSYAPGDIVFVKSECADAACAYISLTNINNSQGINTDWEKLFCLSTLEYSCGNYRRKKSPGDGYRLIKTGPGQYEYVEHPVPYWEYFGNVLKNCGSCLGVFSLFNIWFEGESNQTNVYSKVNFSGGSIIRPNLLISEENPNPESFSTYLNHRPAINKLNEDLLLATWEYTYKYTGNFLGKTLTLYDGGVTPVTEEAISLWFEGDEVESNIYSKILLQEEDEDPVVQISESVPDPGDFSAYLNYRPAINSLAPASLLLTWEYYYKFSKNFESKILTLPGGS